MNPSLQFSCMRPLDLRDAEGMLEWMHDDKIAHVFAKNFSTMQLDDVKTFIKKSQVDKSALHLAVVDDTDEYMGTISLKDIDEENRRAEYAISMRKCAHGTGLSFKATKELLAYAFEKIRLHKVYLNVLSLNQRAIAFYKKCGFKQEGCFSDWVLRDGNYYDLLWFAAQSQN